MDYFMLHGIYIMLVVGLKGGERCNTTENFSMLISYINMAFSKWVFCKFPKFLNTGALSKCHIDECVA